MKSILRNGLIVPLITPLLPNGQVDDTSLRRHAQRITAQNAGALLLGSLAEEYMTLTSNEAEHILRTVTDEIQQRIPVWATVSDPIVKSAARTALKLKKNGASALLVQLPRMTLRSPSGLSNYLSEISHVSGCPLILQMPCKQIHNQLDTLTQLYHDDILSGIVDPGDEPDLSSYLLAGRPKGLSIFSGLDIHSISHFAQGGDGFLSLRCNAQPEIWRGIIECLTEENWNEARHLFFRTLQLPGQVESIRQELSRQGWMLSASRNNLGTTMMTACQNRHRIWKGVQT